MITTEAAHTMGAKGAAPTEAERLLFEAWMRGHCWSLSATWRGVQYKSDSEDGGDLDPRAVQTRRLWAAWRDRAALGSVEIDRLKAEAVAADIRIENDALVIAGLAADRDALRAALAERDAKLAALKQESIDNAKMMLLLTEDLQYIAGIVEKGRGQPTIEDNLTVRSAILGYVQELEAKLAALEGQKPVAYLQTNGTAKVLVDVSRPLVADDIAIGWAQQALYAAAGAAPAPPNKAPEPEPMFWVRLCSDGCYEGPIHNAGIERVRKLAGVWSPLYLHPPAVREPLTNAEIQEIATKAVRERKLSWLGFKKDDQGKYTIPSLSPYHYQFARAIESAVRAKPSTDEHEYLRIQQRNKEVVEAAHGIGVKP